MEVSRIGKEIKDLRKSLNMTQMELCEDICTQAQISKIEKGNVYPSAITLYEISKRLGVDINYFFKHAMHPRPDYIQEVYHNIRSAIRKKNYQEVGEIVQFEKKNPAVKQIPDYRQFLLWHEGIYKYYIYKNTQESIQLLEEALYIRGKKPLTSEQEIGIINSIGVIYLDNEQYDIASHYLKMGIEHLHSVPFYNDIKTVIRLYYNYAITLTELNKFKESMTYCYQGIEQCQESETYYLYGELFYQLGLNQLRQLQLKDAQRNMRKALRIFHITEKKDNIHYVLNMMKEIKNRLNMDKGNDHSDLGDK